MDLEHNENKLSEPEMTAQTPADETSGGLTLEESCQRLTQYLEHILTDAQQAHLDVSQLSQPCRGLGEALRSFHRLAEDKDKIP